MSGSEAIRRDILIKQGAPFSCGPWRIRDPITKFPLDFSAYAGTQIRAQVRQGPADSNPVLVDMTIANGGVLLSPSILPAEPVTGSFVATANTIIAAGALFQTRGATQGDLATLAGGPNDSARRIVSVDSETQITVDGAPFTPAVAGGTVALTNESRFEIFMSSTTTDALDLVDDAGAWDLYVEIAGSPERFYEGVAKLSRTRTR